MSKHGLIITPAFGVHPNKVRDALPEVLREGARTLLAQAIEAEVAEFLAGHAEKRDAIGRARLVRNGHLPERTVQRGIGAVMVKAPRVRDRAGSCALPRRSCRRICGAPRRWKSCCRGCT